MVSDTEDLKSNYPKIADIVDNFNLSVMSVITDEEGKINDLFVRLNHSKPLTGAEVRNARVGIVPKLIRKIAHHTFFRDRIAFNTKRRQDQNVAAKLLLIEYRGKFVDTKKRNLDQFVVEGIESVGITSFERAAERVTTILDHMAKIFIDDDPLLKSEGPLTLYYWFARNTSEELHGRIREFLNEFEFIRRENRDKAKNKAPNVDDRLLSYDIFNRSTNDQSSLAGRYAILDERFQKWLLDSAQQSSSKR